MRASVASTPEELLKVDREVKEEAKEVEKLEIANARLREELDKNEKVGERILTEMGEQEHL